MKKISPLSLKTVLATVLAAATSLPSFAADFDVKIDNLTRGSFFTPFVVAAHPSSMELFESGQSASMSLQAMAEGGDISGLDSDLMAISATMDNNPAGGLLAPGASATSMLNTDMAMANTHLSITSMILPSNDGFVGISGLEIPTMAGEYTYYLNAYDAGTEANDEIRGSGAPGMAGFPVPPVTALSSTIGTSGAGVSGSAEGFVHIHRGVLGDTNASGGMSDIDSTAHRWLNPIAKITITVR